MSLELSQLRPHTKDTFTINGLALEVHFSQRDIDEIWIKKHHERSELRDQPLYLYFLCCTVRDGAKKLQCFIADKRDATYPKITNNDIFEFRNTSFFFCKHFHRLAPLQPRSTT
jgi:hypothetical protein